jgi:hypothetical protein
VGLVRLLIVLAALVVVAAACGQPAPATAPSPSAGATFDLGLPDCGMPPSPSAEAPPPGAVMPPRSRITAVRIQPPLAQLNGYVESTPREVREWIESQDHLEVVVSEDEGYESELLVTDGRRRTFIKAQAICADASLLAEVIADEDAASMLPTPAGSPPPAP